MMYSPAKVNEPKSPELLRIGTSAAASVLSVVDERTTGSIVRSRLNLRVEPSDGQPFEVTVRHVFPSLGARSQVRVGGKVAVRFDPDDHSRVVIAPEAPPSASSGSSPAKGTSGGSVQPAAPAADAEIVDNEGEPEPSGPDDQDPPAAAR